MKLLSVDWDYFFKSGEDNPELWQLYDWGHNESYPPSLMEVLWATRAAGFDRAGIPRPESTGEEVGFWDNFDIREDAVLYVAESHMEIVSIPERDEVTSIYNYDAHHDCGYGGGISNLVLNQTIDCSSWGVYYSLIQKAKMYQVYPSWRNTKSEVNEDGEVGELPPILKTPYTAKRFNRVFLCRSPHWSPPWMDEQFFGLIESFPGVVKYIGEPPSVRPFDEETVRELVKQSQELTASVTKGGSENG